MDTDHSDLHDVGGRALNGSLSLAIQRKFDEKDRKIEILEHALRTAIQEEWCGCPDEVVEERFNFSLEMAEQSIRKFKS